MTLHVGLGTFQPLRAAQVEQGRLHAERIASRGKRRARIRAARRVVAVGTTSVRTIESAWRTGAMSGETDLFIYARVRIPKGRRHADQFPPAAHQPAAAGGAFAGKELTLAAYRHAVEERYRFYSYGDCMLIV